MPRLTDHSYGKSSVRLTRIIRHPGRHELFEASVDTRLVGDFADTYLAGDNSRVIATDSMKNTVYALAAENPWPGVDAFTWRLARHYVERYPQVHQAEITVRQSRWNRALIAGSEHPHTFISAGAELRTSRAAADRTGMQAHFGIDGLLLLKTTDSAFRDFVRDEFTSLPDADDRIFATSCRAEWRHDGGAEGNEADYESIRTALIGCFAMHKSLSVQQTIHAMATAALDAHRAMSQITITMPNQHRVPFNAAALGLPNRNEVFVTTSEPYGLISATLLRE